MCSSSSLIHCFVFLKWPGKMGAGGGGVIVFSIFHYSVSTERGGGGGGGLGWKMRCFVEGLFGSLRKLSLNDSLISLY